MAYGPWIVTGTLYSRNGTYIYSTVMSQYVIKVMKHDKQLLNEMRVLFSILEAPPRHSLSLPKKVYYLYGQTPEAGWYAMKRYDGHVERNSYCKTHLQTIARHCLQFLQDFHSTQRLVHMDIKRGNILCDMDNTEFVLVDYELADSPSSKQLHELPDDYKWYYFGYGAEMDQPLISWRFDLVALGYVLASLTVAEEDWTFEEESEKKRREKTDSTEEELITKRAASLAKADPIVLTYMDKLKEVPWDSKEPPSRMFYEQLEALFVPV